MFKLPQIKYNKSVHSLSILLLVALAVRLLAINQSFWLDEAITAMVAKKYTFGQIIGQFSPTDFHPPLYYLFIKSWTSIFGYSEIAIRMVSVLFSLGTGYILYIMAGFLPASLFLLNPLIVYYSIEARMYMMATFLLTLGFYKLEKQKYFLGLIVLIFAFFTFYGTIFMIAAFIVYYLLKNNWRLSMKIGLSVLLALVILLPLLIFQFQNSRLAIESVANWQSVLGVANIKNLILIPVKFSTGRISFDPKWLYYFLALIWVYLTWHKINYKNKKIVLIIVPMFLGFVFSFVSPLFSYFRFLYLIPFWSLVFFNNKTSVLYKHLIVLGFLGWSLLFILNPNYHREDWRSLSLSLQKNATVYGIESSMIGLNYYRPDIKIKDIRRPIKFKDKIWVVPYTTQIYGFDYLAKLHKENFELKQKIAFRELVLESFGQIE